MLNLAFINTLGAVDIVFFIICAAIIVIAVAIYFLIPVFNKKQYQEQRDNLRKREEAFGSNLSVDQLEKTKETAEATVEDAELETKESK